jgi:hypothetical protein
VPASVHPGIFFSSYLLSKNINIKLYGTIILHVALCWCETGSVILREERRSLVFRSMMLRKILGPKKDKVKGIEETAQ